MLTHVAGIEGLVLRLPYGAGMRLMEGVRLRIKDVDFVRNEILVRDGKSGRGVLNPLDACRYRVVAMNGDLRTRRHEAGSAFDEPLSG